MRESAGASATWVERIPAKVLFAIVGLASDGRKTPTAEVKAQFADRVCEAPGWARAALGGQSSQPCLEDARDVTTIWTVVRDVLTEVDDGDSVVLETTGGVRSISIGFLLATGLLRALRPKVSVLAVTYAELGAGRQLDDPDTKTTSPVYDLRPFLELFDWAFAAKSFLTRLDAGPLADLVDDGPLTDPLASFARILDLGWPGDLVSPIRALEAALNVPTGGATPASTESLALVGRELSVLFAALPANGDESNPEFWLDVAQSLATAGRFGDSVRVLREAMVNRMLAEQSGGGTWRDDRSRRTAETALFRKTTGEVKALWQEVGEVRNAASYARANQKHETTEAEIAEFARCGPDRVRRLSSDSWLRPEKQTSPVELVLRTAGLRDSKKWRTEMRKKVEDAEAVTLVDLEPAEEHRWARVRHAAGLSTAIVRAGSRVELSAED